MSENTSTVDDGLADKTWMQLRQCTYIALFYLRGQGRVSPGQEDPRPARGDPGRRINGPGEVT